MVAKNKVIQGKKYGLILNGKYITKSKADAFIKRIKKVFSMTDQKKSVRKVNIGKDKYVVYMEGANGTTFKNKKTSDL